VTAAASRELRVFVIAGEESGDRLGGALMAAMKARAGRPVRFRGIGGRSMAQHGLDSLFPLENLAINGFSAILVRLPQILARIREAADAVIADDPDVLVIIDNAGFTHRVARRVRARAPRIPIVDYVSPQVWASRPGRAAAMRASGRITLPARTGVLVKAPKRGQDRRFDLPSIGPDTVIGAAKAGLAGIAVTAGATIVAEPQRLVAEADRAGLFVVGHEDAEASPLPGVRT